MPSQDTTAPAKPPFHEALQHLTGDRLPLQGVIIAIDNPPSGDDQDGSSSSPIAPASPGPQTLAGFAQDYDHEVARFGSVTAIAPSRMVVLNTKPGTPDPFVGMSRHDAMHLFLSSLSSSQWSQIGSPTGIGLGDLTFDQSALFNALIPNPFRLRQETAQEGGSFANGDIKKSLSEKERQGIHLRLNLATQIMPMPSAIGQGITINGGPVLHNIGDTFLIPDTPDADPSQDLPYGVPLRAEVPNTSKPSQLPMENPVFAAKVHLSPSSSQSTGPFIQMTVGDLIHQVSAATQTELYADKRLGQVPIWVHGRDAVAADLLKALCLCVTGAFRQVGPAFVLTDDLQGIGSRKAVLADWLSDAEMQRQELLQRLEEQTGTALYPSQLTFAPSDPLANEPGLASDIISHRDQSFSSQFTKKSVSSLPPKLRSDVEKVIQWAVQQNQPVSTTDILLDMQVRLTYLVPGVGEVTDLPPDISSLSDLTGAVLPLNITHAKRPTLDFSHFHSRVLYVTASSPSEVAQAIRLAHQSHMDELWIGSAPNRTVMPTTPVDKGKSKLKIRVVVSLLDRGTEEASEDVNPLAQASPVYYKDRLHTHEGLHITEMNAHFLAASKKDWVISQSPEAQSQWSELTALGRWKGLDGIVLEASCAPGYESPGTDALTVRSQIMASIRRPDAAAGDLGYTTALRLAYLRRSSIDPIDIVGAPIRSAANLTLPLFPATDDFSESLKWDAFRYGQNKQWLGNLYSEFRKAHPSTSLLMEERSDSPKWFGSWDQPTLLPLATSDFPSVSFYDQAHRFSQSVFLNAPLPPESSQPADYPQYLSGLLTQNQKFGDWDGIVLNLSGLLLDQAALYVKSITKDTPQPQLP